MTEARSGFSPWRRLSVLFLLLLPWFAVAAFGQIAVPTLKARVTDLTGTLSASQAAQLEEKLKAFESRKGSQIAVLIVPTTQPEAVEQYSIRAAEQWKLGRKGVDDGVLLLVAKNDRTLRIEVGYGLEGTLPDVTASRIIREIITPRFKQGDFFGGISAGVDRIIGAIEGEPLPPPQPRDARVSGGPLELFFFALVAIAIGGGILRALFGRLAAATITGAVIGGIAGALLASWVVAIVAGFISFLFTLAAGSRGVPGRSGHWGGGWSSGGGGFSGGGFSGGGGGFGGGGASGRW